MPTFVVDASTIAKWVLSGEPYEENALRLKADNVQGIAVLHVPDIFRYKLANVLWKASRLSKVGRISTSDAKSALETLSHLKLNIHNQDWGELIESFEVASEIGLSLYDASYLRLGANLGVPVLTADDGLMNAAKKKFRILHLKDY
jgi:predicted nucleic acid-binding protein